ncbi:E3 ubiquitin-protein ligase mind-bomb [Gryllus bimaculatus]|nr:E3 ubiquitin-protein ligase mind-bomb [Gryllus bimaculatus]
MSPINRARAESGLHVENQSVMKEGKLKFVPADSTTPTIVNVCSTSAHQKTGNLSSTEPKFIVCQENLDKGHLDPSVIGRQSHSSSLIDSNNIYDNESQNSIQNIVIVNAPQNVASCNAATIPKANIDEIMRRRKIALKFQQDMQRAKEMPRIEKTLVLPARKVSIVDSSTQTSLFCMLEPGRMVEMFLNDHTNDSKITKQCGNQEPHIGMKETSQFISNVSEHHKASTNCQTAVNDQINPPLSKRIRLNNTDTGSGAVEESINSYNRIMNNDPLLTSSMDFDDLIPSFESLGKENIESTNINMPSKNYETCDLQNNNLNNINNTNNINNISVPLSCLQSTLNRNVNCLEKNAVNKFVQSKEGIQTLLKDYRDSLIPDEDGNLPLHNAVMDRDVKQVQRQCLVLSARKQSVDVKNKMKETALHLAVLCHDVEITKVLLKFKAKPNIPDSEGNTPVHMAIIWGNNIEILQELLTYVEDNSPTLNMPNDEGFSPLHLCALHNKPSEAALLVKKNVEVNIRDRKSGRTPLFHAVENGNSEISQVLLNAGAHTHIPNFSGQTALNASELTFVLDELSRNVDPPKTIKPQVVPCVCRDKTKEDRTSNVSFNRNVLVLERTDIDEFNSNNDLCNINFIDTVLHNR